MEQIRWIFIDVGDTLMDEGPAQQKRIRDLIAREASLGRVRTYDEICGAILQCAREYESYLFGGALRRLGIPYDLPFDKELEKPFPGGAEVLRTLRERGYRIAVLANQPLGTRQRMERYGFLPYLDQVFGSAEVGLSKPDPAFYRYALEQTGADPARSVMVGDRLDNDVWPARQCGMKAIRVRQGFAAVQEARTPDHRPDAAVDNLYGLLNILPQIGKEGAL